VSDSNPALFPALRDNFRDTRYVGIFLSVFTGRAAIYSVPSLIYLRPCTIEMHPSKQPNRFSYPPTRFTCITVTKVAIEARKQSSRRQQRGGRREIGSITQSGKYGKKQEKKKKRKRASGHGWAETDAAMSSGLASARYRTSQRGLFSFSLAFLPRLLGDYIYIYIYIEDTSVE